ncbi:MAG: hypothetical protein ACXWU5_11645 [Rhodoplanes sp.]
MRKLALAAVLALSSSAAYAQSFEIPINGGVARIELNDKCRKDLCCFGLLVGTRLARRAPGIQASGNLREDAVEDDRHVCSGKLERAGR